MWEDDDKLRTEIHKKQSGVIPLLLLVGEGGILRGCLCFASKVKGIQVYWQADNDMGPHQLLKAHTTDVNATGRKSFKLCLIFLAEER